MKTTQKIISLFLAFIFLLSSLGFTANKMVCLKSGKTKLSLVHLKDCCPEKKSVTPLLKSDCCNINNIYFNLSDFQHAEKNNIEQPSSQISFVNPTQKFKINTSTFVLTHSSFVIPPKLSGRELLSFISILTI